MVAHLVHKSGRCAIKCHFTNSLEESHQILGSKQNYADSTMLNLPSTCIDPIKRLRESTSGKDFKISNPETVKYVYGCNCIKSIDTFARKCGIEIPQDFNVQLVEKVIDCNRSLSLSDKKKAKKNLARSNEYIASTDSQEQEYRKKKKK